MQDICVFCVCDHRIGTLLEQAHCADDREAAAICNQDVCSHHENRFSPNSQRIDNSMHSAICLMVCPMPKRCAPYGVHSRSVILTHSIYTPYAPVVYKSIPSASRIRTLLFPSLKTSFL